MAKRPYVSFAEVKAKVPIPEALAALGLVDRFQRNGEVLTGICPLPAHKHGPHPNPEQFKINRKDGVWLWHCFGDCKKGGDVVELVKEMTGYDDAHVRFWFAEKFGDRLALGKPRGRETPEKDAADEEPEGEAPQVPPAKASTPPEKPAPLKPLRFHLILEPEAPYLRKRGLTAETIQRYGLGLCSRGVLKGYVAIPVYGWPHPEDANPLAYLGRWPGDKDTPDRPRYRWPEGFPKSRVVYGLAQAMEGTEGQPLIVVEGPFKVYHLVQGGFPATVAIFGSSLSDEQAAILVGTGRRIVLFFDGNEAGQTGMRLAAAKLITKTFVRVVRLPEDKEPDDYGPEQLRELLP